MTKIYFIKKHSKKVYNSLVVNSKKKGFMQTEDRILMDKKVIGGH